MSNTDASYSSRLAEGAKRNWGKVLVSMLAGAGVAVLVGYFFYKPNQCEAKFVEYVNTELKDTTKEQAEAKDICAIWAKFFKDHEESAKKLAGKYANIKANLGDEKGGNCTAVATTADPNTAGMLRRAGAPKLSAAARQRIAARNRQRAQEANQPRSMSPPVSAAPKWPSPLN